MKNQYDSDRDLIMESLRNFVAKHNVLDYTIEFNKNDNPMLHKIVITKDETETPKYVYDKFQFGDHFTTKRIVVEDDDEEYSDDDNCFCDEDECFCDEDECCFNCCQDDIVTDDNFGMDDYNVITEDIDKIITIKDALDFSGRKYEMIIGNDDEITIKYL